MQKKTLIMVLALLLLGAGFFFFEMRKKEPAPLPESFGENPSSTSRIEATNEITSTTMISPESQKSEVFIPKPKKEYANPTDACIGEYLEKGETDVSKILSMCLGISQ